MNGFPGGRADANVVAGVNRDTKPQAGSVVVKHVTQLARTDLNRIATF